jgi:Fe2+ transport system protein FeoA
MPPGGVGSIASLNVDPEDAIRLKSLGICVGREVQLVQAGDPIIIRVLGTRVGLSARLATGVVVSPTPEAPSRSEGICSGKFDAE